MIANLQRLPIAQRRLVFILMFIGGLLAIIGLTALLISLTVNGQRAQGVAIDKSVTVAPFAELPDKDAYPAAVAVGPDGTVYTASYATGAVWAIDAAGKVRELPYTRDEIGAVSGLAVAPNGTIYAVDQHDTDPRSAGGDVKQIAPDGKITVFATIDDARGFVSPYDVELDSAGHVYVSDRGRNEVWRFDADGRNGVAWWTPTIATGQPKGAITGLAYNVTDNSLIVTDPDIDVLYRVSIADAQADELYRYRETAEEPTGPGFNGATFGADGALYVAALGRNTVVTLRDGKLVTLAGNFRGASDVAFGAPNKLYVTNFDQTSLVIPLVQPRLPFALDVLTLSPAP